MILIECRVKNTWSYTPIFPDTFTEFCLIKARSYDLPYLHRLNWTYLEKIRLEGLRQFTLLWLRKLCYCRFVLLKSLKNYELFRLRCY